MCIAITAQATDLWSSTENSTTGTYRLSWAAGTISPPPRPPTDPTFPSVKSSLQQSVSLAPSDSLSLQKASTSYHALFENGRKIAVISDTGSFTVSGKGNGSYKYDITSCINTWYCTDSNQVIVTVALANYAPTITNISNKTINEDSNTGNVTFSIGDAETSTSSLSLSKASSNLALVPTGNIVFGGSGANRTVRVTPLANQYGSSTITVTVSDGTNTSSDSFLVTVRAVDDTPTIAYISNKIIDEDGNIGNTQFTVGDIDTNPQSLVISKTSSNTGLIPTSNIVINNLGFYYSINVTPQANKYGSSTITLNVSDGSTSRNESFLVTVNSVNDTPTISNISNKTINEDSSTGYVAFSIGDVETSVNSLLLSKASSNLSLVPTGNIVFGGSGTNRTVRVTPVANKYGSSTITITVSDGNKTRSDSYLVTVNAVNDTPTISNISNKTINEDSSTGYVAFSIGDVETSANSLLLSKASSNLSLVPTGNIVFGGSGANRTVRVTPVANKYGSSTITVTVSDGNKTRSDSYLVTVNSVNDTPTISNISNKTINEDSSTGYVAFSIGDVETSVNSLLLSKASSNLALVPTGNIVFGGSGANRTVLVTPVANKYGSSTITITVSDGNKTRSDSYLVTVNSVNDTPTISNISNKTIDEDTDTGNVAFSISDVETSVNSLLLSKASSNLALVPTGNIVFGGSGTNRTVLVTPAANKFGSSTITITLSDGNKTRSESFIVNVTSIVDLATISKINKQVINEDESSEDISFEMIRGDVKYHSVSIHAKNNNSDMISNQYSNSNTIPNLYFDIKEVSNEINLDNLFPVGKWTVKITPRAEWSGEELVTLIASGVTSLGEYREIAESNFVVAVNPVNDAPIISGIQDKSAYPHNVYNFIPDVIDIDSGTLSFTIINKPKWASFDRVTGRLSGIPTEADVGLSEAIVISVSDGELFSALPAFRIEVSSKKRVIFIHTDILGTPVAETNKDGVIQ